MRLLGIPWRESLSIGALLAQVGEFSFVLAAVGYQANVINESGHQLAIAVIALCLIVSPAWMAWGRSLRRSGASPTPQGTTSALGQAESEHLRYPIDTHGSLRTDA